MRKIHGDLYRSHDDEGCKGCLLQKVYLSTEVDAHLAALQAQHAEAMAEKDKRITRLEEKEAVIYDSFAIYSELPPAATTISANQLSAVLDAIARIWKRMP